MACEEMAEPIR